MTTNTRSGRFISTLIHEVRPSLYRTLMVVIGVLTLLCLGGTVRAQDYLSASGMPAFVAPQPVEQGFTDESNGNLHLQFSFGSYSQRASSQPFVVSYVYDSDMLWDIGCSGSSCAWAPSNYNGYGWRLATNAGTLTGMNCNTSCEEWAFTDALGTTHYFPVSTGSCPIPNAYASDSSGHMLNLCQTGVYAPDGTLVYSAQYEDPVSPGQEDSNGNYLTWGVTGDQAGETVDTAGRSLALTTLNCNGNANEICYTVPNAQGGVSTYTVTTATISVQTDFGQSGVSEFSGTITVVQSIEQPDGTSYTFKYDCNSGTDNAACGSPSGQNAYYGMLTSMTLPTGGTVSYTYTDFSDVYGNKSEWLYSRTLPGGALWRYEPSTSDSCSATQFGSSCQQEVEVIQPNGDYSVTTFTLDNGAWPVKVVSYNSSSTLMSTTTNTYDFSQACPFTNCHGNSYIRLLSTQTTIPAPSGNLTKQTEYQYDSPQTGNITATQEWSYYPGSFPSVPDRATYTQYLTTGTNDINRPTSVTLCNNSGSSSSCPGGGSMVQQTLYTYDNYSSCSNGTIVSVSGIQNHDDTNFGSGYTTRGNATQIQQWVSGSTYLTTERCYDTTGQVTQSEDPKGNVTKFGYADAYYSDNGTNSLSSYTPSKPTNAYVTSITQPIIGTSTAGYYWGSGGQAFSTDPNGVTGYAHYMDPFNRSTEDSYALVGWDMTTYTSPTETDSYSAVGTTAPSTGCSSCQHEQILLDSLGRKIDDNTVNYPGGQITVATAYDVNGRVQTVSHPYQGSSGAVYETYTYDGLDRVTAVTHPDGESVTTLYGTAVEGTGGGLTTQQGSTSTYGYGYPVLYRDEAGQERQEWIDGFGRVIEVDEPTTEIATAGTGSVSIIGSDQSKQIGSCPLIVTAGGSVSPQSPCETIWDAGTISITVGGFVAQTDYSEESTSDSLASALASILNESSSPVTAVVSGNTIDLTSKDTGVASNYALSSTSASNDSHYFSSPSFVGEPSGSTLTGGTNSSPTLQSPASTFYTYDAANDLTEVVQGVQTRTFVYDGVGRPTSVATPEAGTETFAYSASGSLCSGDSGNVCQRTDARGVVTNYYYDALNRLTGKSYTIPSGSAVAAMPNICTASTGQSANVCYNYDQGGATAYALGRRTQMVDPSGSETYTYDAAGRITQTSKVIGTTTYVIGQQYNAGDEPTQLTYPSGRVVQMSYNAVGQICEIAPSTSGCGTSGSPYSTGYTYDAAAQLTAFNYGNGVAASYGYSTATRSQLTSLAFTSGATTLFSLGYWYQQNASDCPNGNSVGNNGQIQCITDAVDGGRTVNYTYDVLGRLGTAETNGDTNFPQWGLSWSYDRYGNRLSQTVTAGSGYSNSLTFGDPGGAQTNQPDGWCFDASGNLLGETGACPPANAFVYDGEDHMVSDPAAGEAYLYDGNGMRVETCSPSCSSPTSSTVYIYSGSQDIAEYENGAAPASPSAEYVYTSAVPGSGLLASIVDGTTTYFQSDHLGWRVSTNTSGTVVGQQGNYPFGQSWYSSNGNEFAFTSYQYDSQSGLNYALARYYDASVGRFCTADPAGGSPDTPQTWDRYTYAGNDPIDNVDPSGKSWWQWLVGAAAVAAAIVVPEVDPALFGELVPATASTTASATATTTIASSSIVATDAATGSVIGTSSQFFTWSVLDAQLNGALMAGSSVLAASNASLKPQQPHNQAPKMKDCPPTNAHGVRNNLPTRAPNRDGAYGVPETPGTAAIDRSQWLPSGSNMTGAQANAYISQYSNQISGYVPNGNGGYTQVFNGVSDNINASGVSKLLSRYPGRVLFELPGGKDLGNVNNMRFRVPSKMPCPHS